MKEDNLSTTLNHLMVLSIRIKSTIITKSPSKGSFNPKKTNDQRPLNISCAPK